MGGGKIDIGAFLGICYGDSSIEVDFSLLLTNVSVFILILNFFTFYNFWTTSLCLRCTECEEFLLQDNLSILISACIVQDWASVVCGFSAHLMMGLMSW